MTRPPSILDRIIDRNLLPIFACEQGYKVGVEIGTFRGEYAAHCLANWPGLLYTVDPFENQDEAVYRDGCNQVPMQEVATDAMMRLDPWIKDGRCHLLIMDSMEASKRFTAESICWAHLDGCHSFEVVSQEIAVYWPLIRPGGVLTGHDCYSRDDSLQRADVANAVFDFAERIGVRPRLLPCTSWVFLKP